MHSIKKFPLLLAGLILLSFACKKDDPTPLTPPASSNNNNSNQGNPTPTDADAVVYALIQRTTQDSPFGPIELSQSVPFGVFVNNNGSPVSVGDVFVEGRKMTYLSGTYAYFPGFMDTMGLLEFQSNDVEWQVSGGNGFPSFTRVDNSYWPEIGLFTSSSTLSKSSDFTVSVSGLVYADSTSFTIGENLSVTLPGSVSSYTFSSSELSSLSLISGELLAVSAYTLNKETIGSKNIYFAKMLVSQTPLTVTP